MIQNQTPKTGKKMNAKTKAAIVCIVFLILLTTALNALIPDYKEQKTDKEIGKECQSDSIVIPSDPNVKFESVTLEEAENRGLIQK